MEFLQQSLATAQLAMHLSLLVHVFAIRSNSLDIKIGLQKKEKGNLLKIFMMVILP